LIPTSRISPTPSGRRPGVVATAPEGIRRSGE
jgi:hypothetical protein